MEEIYVSNKTNRNYALNNDILNEFENAGNIFSQKVNIKEYIYNIIVSKSNWFERLEIQKNLFEYCLKSGLLTEIE